MQIIADNIVKTTKREDRMEKMIVYDMSERYKKEKPLYFKSLLTPGIFRLTEPSDGIKDAFAVAIDHKGNEIPNDKNSMPNFGPNETVELVYLTD